MKKGGRPIGPASFFYARLDAMAAIRGEGRGFTCGIVLVILNTKIPYLAEAIHE
jgi:hypothetical protein